MVFGWGKKESRQNVSDVALQKKQILLSDVQNIVSEIRSIQAKTIIVEANIFFSIINYYNYITIYIIWALWF